MISRITILALLISLLISPCCIRNSSTGVEVESPNNSLSLNGNIEDGAGEVVILEEMGAREFIPLDTVVCDEKGNFEISLSPTSVAFYVLRYGQSGYVTLLMEPGENIKFSGNIDKLQSYSVKGSAGSVLLQDLAMEHKATLNSLAEVTRKNMEYASSPDYTAKKQVFDHQFDSITTRFREYSLAYISDNSGSMAILIALYNLYGQGLPVFHPETDLQVYQYVDSALMSQYSEFEAVQLLHAQVAAAIQMTGDQPQVEQLQAGEIAPDFVSSRPDGSPLALSDLKGRYVLLSFWAGWSHLSREENPSMLEAYEVFGDRGFQILQVSLDNDRREWTDAISKDRLNWDHVSDLKRWDTPVADLYHVEKIPFNVLIDPSGRVLATNLFGTQLMNKLENIFSQ